MTDLIKRSTPTIARSSWSAVESRDNAWNMAKMIASSGLCPADVKTPEQVMVILMMGDELGLAPMQALRSIHVIKGRPALSAQLMASLVVSSGTCEQWSIVESTDKVCRIIGQRVGGAELEIKWTIDQAKTAGLLKNQVWIAFPAAMLRHRCESDLARALWPDIVGGFATPEEIRSNPIRESQSSILASAIEYQDPPKLPGVSSDIRALVEDGYITESQAIDASTYGIRSFVQLAEHLAKGLSLARLSDDRRTKLREVLEATPSVIDYRKITEEEEEAIDGIEFVRAVSEPPDRKLDR